MPLKVNLTPKLKINLKNNPIDSRITLLIAQVAELVKVVAELIVSRQSVRQHHTYNRTINNNTLNDSFNRILVEQKSDSLIES